MVIASDTAAVNMLLEKILVLCAAKPVIQDTMAIRQLDPHRIYTDHASARPFASLATG